MAIIRFDPTWVTSVKRFPNPEYRNGYPLESGSSYDSWNAYVGFDFSEIGRILSMFTVNGKYLKTKASITVGAVLHANLTAPSESNQPTADSGAAEPIGSFDGDYYKLNLDQSLAYAGLSGPVYTSLQGAINLGYQGFVLLPEWNKTLVTNEVFVELEGNFENPRPTPTSPVGGTTLNRHETIRFNWNHNSSFNQTKYEFRYRIKGTSTWTTIQNNTNTRYHNLPEGTLTTNEYEWQVRTTSEYDFISPWSLVQVFNAAETTPSPVFVNPTNNSTIEISDLNVMWTSVNQHQYEFELRDNNNNIVWSDARISSDKAITLPDILDNNRTYRLRLRVNQQGNFFSPWVQISINVSYTQPGKPILNIIPNEQDANMLIRINNPPPTGTQPRSTHQALFKREIGGSWIKLANLLPNSDFVDYAVASGQQYEYRVTVYADNDTSITSNMFRNSIEIDQTVINVANESNIFIKLDIVRERSALSELNAIRKRFAGRKYPVTEFGETVENGIEIECLVEDHDDYDYLVNMINRQETLIYRDARGRKVYATVSGLTVVDESLGRYSVSMAFSQVDYKEGIDYYGN